MSERRINEAACRSAGMRTVVPKLDDLSGTPIPWPPRPFPKRRSIVLNLPCSRRQEMCTYRSCLPCLPSFLFLVGGNAYLNFALLLVALQLLNAISSGQLVVPSVPSAQESPVQSLPSNNSSSNALREYVIYSVVDGPSRDADNERIRLHLGMILAPADVHEYGGAYTGVEFWRVKMSDMQRTAFVSANPKVCPILPCRTWLLTNAKAPSPSELAISVS